ncbi:MAG TPA: hypothetical protein VKF41_06360 [Bryobacteraceae bacterium]|nr:hypothetical protein [Bryobacteraceae bacterium]
MIRAFMVSLIVLLICSTAKAGEAGLKTQFIGGTLPGVHARSTARLDLTQTDSLRFSAGRTELSIPYRKIDTLEYGQNVSRRVALAVAISPLLLLSKSRQHFVTIGYEDAEGQRQALVFRVGKGDIRTVMAGLEARTGQRFTFLDDEARKAGQ